MLWSELSQCIIDLGVGRIELSVLVGSQGLVQQNQYPVPGSFQGFGQVGRCGLPDVNADPAEYRLDLEIDLLLHREATLPPVEMELHAVELNPGMKEGQREEGVLQDFSCVDF